MMRKFGNDGFTAVELMVSFTLTMIIMVMLFQIILILKDVYVSSGVKTELLLKNSNFLRYIQTDLHSRDLTSLRECGDNCYRFSYADGESLDLVMDLEANTIAYGSYKVKMVDGTVMRPMEAHLYRDSTVDLGNDTIISILLPIRNKILPTQNSDISIVFQVDSKSNFVTDLSS